MKARMGNSKHPADKVMQYLDAQLSSPGIKDNCRLETIREIAGKLDVSTHTVQRVFHKLSHEGRIYSRVGDGSFLKALQPSHKDTIKIAVNIKTLDYEIDGWFSRVFGGIFNGMLRLRQGIVISPSHVERAPEPLLKEELIAKSREVDGLLLLAPSGDYDSVRAAYRDVGTPVVELNFPRDNATENFVSPDYFGASHKLGEAWRLTGRSRTLLLLGSPVSKSVSGRQRLAGLLSGLSVEPDDSKSFRIVCAEPLASETSVRGDMERLLKENWMPDSIYCAGDYLAASCLKVLREKGLRIPEDVSVIGGTGLDLSMTEFPMLTRTRQPLEEMGQALAEMLVQKTRNGNADMPGKVITTPFIGGESTRSEENKLLGINNWN